MEKIRITKEQIYKFRRKANRELIKSLPPKVHRTHKKDKKRNNTVKRQDYDNT